MKTGETFDKIGKPGNFEEVNFFPASAPGTYQDLSKIITKFVIGLFLITRAVE